MVTVNERHYERRRTATQLASENPTLDAELCFESDTDHFKRGPGAWNSLPYADASSLPELATSDPTKVPVATVGDTTTLDVDSLATTTGVSSTLYVQLAADSTPVNNSTTLVNVTGLALAVAANCTYLIDSFICSTSTTVAKIKFGWTVPASADGRWVAYGINTSATGTSGSIIAQRNTWAQAQGVAGAGATIVHRCYGLLITAGTAGNLQLQFAQNVLEASNTVVNSFSSLWATRLA